MKRICISLFALSVCFCFSSTALGATTRVATSLFGNTAQFPGVRLDPITIQVGDPLHCSVPGCSQEFSSSSSQPFSIAIDGSASFQAASAVAHASAHAEIGNLGVSIQAGASAGMEKNRAEVRSSAVAEWRSGVTFQVPELVGGEYTVTSLLYLDGDMSGSASGENAQMYADFRIEYLGGLGALPEAPYADGSWGSIHASNGGPEKNEIPNVIRLTRIFRSQFSTAIGFRFLLGGSAFSDSLHFSADEATAGTAFVAADASHSLRWGGVESVIDEFGNPVTNWTLIGDDGFDFSKPFPVPEPTGVVSALGALLFLGFRRIGRRSVGHS